MQFVVWEVCAGRVETDLADLIQITRRCEVDQGLAAQGTWDEVPAVLTAQADAAGVLDWWVAVDSTIARAHQHATNIARPTGGWVELPHSVSQAA